jgi:hypothetical protein
MAESLTGLAGVVAGQIAVSVYGDWPLSGMTSAAQKNDAEFKGTLSPGMIPPGIVDIDL